MGADMRLPSVLANPFVVQVHAELIHASAVDAVTPLAGQRTFGFDVQEKRRRSFTEHIVRIDLDTAF